jgi:hypothetical protein
MERSDAAPSAIADHAPIKKLPMKSFLVGSGLRFQRKKSLLLAKGGTLKTLKTPFCRF